MDNPPDHRDAALPDRPQYHGPMAEREWVAIQVRTGDVVPHEITNPTQVRRMVAHLRSGNTLPPVEIETEWRTHWTQGPDGMEAIGTGFGLLDGHHRVAAHRIVHGADSAIDAVYTARRLVMGAGEDSEIEVQAGTGTPSPAAHPKP